MARWAWRRHLCARTSSSRRTYGKHRPAMRMAPPWPLLLASVLTGWAGVLVAGGSLSVALDHAPCVRLFHADGDVGCRTPNRHGVAQPLLLIDDETKLREFEGRAIEALDQEAVADSAGVSPEKGARERFIAVIADHMLSGSVLERLSSTGLLDGVLVLEDVDARFDIDASYPWNPSGDGLLMKSHDFPVVLVTDESSADVRARAVANGEAGHRYPQHMAQMTYYFGGSETGLNSQACLEWTGIDGERSPQCLPLGGQSVWASLGPPGVDDKETVFAVAGMDSTSMFHDRAPGANSAVSGLVALLGAAESLAAAGRTGNLDFSSFPRQIVFAAFQADAYGFTGSRRFVKDWRRGVECHNKVEASDSPTGSEMCLDPLYPSMHFRDLGNPAHVVSVDQVGCLPEATLWVHPAPGASAANLGSLWNGMPAITGGVSLANATLSELPPSPLTAFVKANLSQSGFVISGYNEAFACPHYHSHRDGRSQVNASSVRAAAEVLARSTLVLAGGTPSDTERPGAVSCARAPAGKINQAVQRLWYQLSSPKTRCATPAAAALQALSVNATLVEVLLDCFLADWTCDTFREYVLGELVNMEEVLGFGVSVDARSPPSFYAGPLEFSKGGGLPTVRHTKSDGSWQLHPTWANKFDAGSDKIQLVPSLLEIFCRAFLSEQLSSAWAGGYGTASCKSSRDCPTGQCVGDGSGRGSGSDRGVTVSETRSDSNDDIADPSVGGSGQRQECVRGRCACPSGFHHIALDVGLEREDTINQYRVLDDASEEGAALWTEVNWRSIGVEVYLDPGPTVGKIAMGLGVVMTVASGVFSWGAFRSLSKSKLL